MTMKKLLKFSFILLVLGIILDFSYYPHSSAETKIKEKMKFDLQPKEVGVLTILPKTDKNWTDGKNIIFVFTNGDCSKSVQYHVRLEWGPYRSKQIPIPCGGKREYWTGYEGGDVPLTIRFENPNPGKTVKSATVTTTQGTGHNDKIPWE